MHRPLNIPEASPSEAALHESVAELLDTILLPPAFYTTFPAGWGKLTKATGGRLKGSGLKAGMPDILIFFLEKTHGIELKARGRSASAAQRTTFAQLDAAGVKIQICYSLDDVVNCLGWWGIPHRDIHL
jgi:hypothetical protein